MITWEDLNTEDMTPDWRARTSFGRLLTGKDAVTSAARRWQPLNPLLVAAPGKKALYPVLEYPEFRDKAFRSARKNQIATMAIAALWTVVILMIGTIRNDHRLLNLATGAGLISAYLCLDYVTVTKNLVALSERAAFVIWLHRRGLVAALGWALFLFCCGLVQIFLQHKLGGLEPVVRSVGLLYEYTNSGQWWRIATGPFIHASVAHWAANLALLSLVGGLTTPISKFNSIAVFLTGVWASAAAAASPLDWNQQDAFAGVSGGIFAMLGWCAIVAIRNPSLFPRRFGLTVLSFGILNLLLTWLLIPNASTVAHIAGWCAGIVWSISVPFRGKPNWRNYERQHNPV